MPHHRLLVVATVALTSALSGLLVTPSASAVPESDRVVGAAPSAGSAARTPPPARRNFKVPKVGSCHNLKPRHVQQKHDTKKAVPCSQRHVLRTVAVKRVTRQLDWNDSNAVYSAVYQACIRGYNRFLGGTDVRRAMSAYGTNTFVPTPAQRRRGASWIRCDVGLYAGKRRVIALPRDLTVRKGRLPDRIARCLGAEPLWYSCAATHRARARHAFRLQGSQPPTREEAYRISRRCAPHVKKGRGLYTVTWTPGNHVMVCYDRTRR